MGILPEAVFMMAFLNAAKIAPLRRPRSGMPGLSIKSCFSTLLPKSYPGITRPENPILPLQRQTAQRC
ncbi:MAG: hypothetical protein J6A48_07865, partial [Clostridia bacterium]|nr:hypothetical protein [Clostridia bacterium]